LGEPANSMAIAPMDIRKGRMRISATGISFGKSRGGEEGYLTDAASRSSSGSFSFSRGR
jgi:hypothetical protein